MMAQVTHPVSLPHLKSLISSSTILTSPLSLSLPAAPSSLAGLQGGAIVFITGRAAGWRHRLRPRQVIVFVAGGPSSSLQAASDLPFFLLYSASPLCSALFLVRSTCDLPALLHSIFDLPASLPSARST
ncbi:hypothetical protein ACLOJK_008395 [Asimina triloba]